MPVLPLYRNQSTDLLSKLTGFYMRATLAFNGLISGVKTLIQCLDFVITKAT